MHFTHGKFAILVRVINCQKYVEKLFDDKNLPFNLSAKREVYFITAVEKVICPNVHILGDWPPTTTFRQI